MKRTIAVVVCCLSVACGKDSPTAPSTPPPPSNITITGPDVVTLGSTGTFTASSSTCTWNTTEGYIATVVAGVVTGNQSGQTTVYCEQQGVRGSKTIRVLPNYQGSWVGSYSITGCNQSGLFTTLNPSFCSNFAVSRVYPLTASFSQNTTSVSGTFNLGQVTGQTVVASIATDGTLRMTVTHNSAASFSVTSSWNVNLNRSGQIVGDMSNHWTATSFAGEGNFTGSLFNVNRQTGVIAPAVLHFRSLDDLLHAVAVP